MLICLPLCLAGLAVRAQTPPASQFTVGDTVFTAAQFHINLGTSDALFSGGVTAKSPDYDLKAETVTVFGTPGTRQTISKVVAVGDPSRGLRVTGHFHQAGTDRTYQMVADQAVYVPDDSRPGGGTIDLTGHPVLTVTMPDALAAPAPIVAEHILVRLGSGADYPQVDGTNGQATFVPLHQ
jgi:lipopolysaccharide export system protein LptA